MSASLQPEVTPITKSVELKKTHCSCPSFDSESQTLKKRSSDSFCKIYPQKRRKPQQNVVHLPAHFPKSEKTNNYRILLSRFPSNILLPPNLLRIMLCPYSMVVVIILFNLFSWNPLLLLLSDLFRGPCSLPGSPFRAPLTKPTSDYLTAFSISHYWIQLIRASLLLFTLALKKLCRQTPFPGDQLPATFLKVPKENPFWPLTQTFLQLLSRCSAGKHFRTCCWCLPPSDLLQQLFWSLLRVIGIRTSHTKT